MAEFNGTIEIKHNPVTTWETYSHTFERSDDPTISGYSNLKFTQRAEGGFYRASFVIKGPRDFMSDFMQNALGRQVVIYGNDGQHVWEGYIHEMEYDAGRAVYKIDLGGMANAVWVRFRVRGTATTERSVVKTDTNSIAKFGRKEFVLSAGELESTDVADNAATSYLDLHKWPRPAPTRLDPERDLAEYPTINVGCRGWFETLNWCTYNQTASTDAQAANSQISAVVSDTDIGQFIATTELDANGTQVSKEYDADRRGGDIVRDIARLGDKSSNRWLVYMEKDRHFVFAESAPPEDPD